MRVRGEQCRGWAGVCGTLHISKGRRSSAQNRSKCRDHGVKHGIWIEQKMSKLNVTECLKKMCSVDKKSLPKEEM